MPISVSCPSCAAKLQAPDAAVGRKTKCPKCGGVIQIAAATPASLAKPTSAPGPASAAVPQPATAQSSNTKPAAAKPAVRVPMAQAALPDLPPLAAEFSAADFGAPASLESPMASSLPRAQPAAKRGTSLVLYIVLGVVAFMIFVGYVIAPLVLKNDNKMAGGHGNDAEEPSDEQLAALDTVVQQVHAEYTIPDDEKKPPRPPAKLTPRESKLLYVINGDRLGMTTEEFRNKYRHKLKGDSRPSPMMSDHRHRAARQDNPLETLAEQPWHVDANIVHARITWPFEDTANSSFTPKFGGVRATDHRFMFVDEQLWRMQFVFPSDDFAQVKQAVIAQLGQPNAAPSPLGVALRGVFPGAILSWSNELAAVDLVERSLEGDKTILMIRHLALEKVDDSRRPPKNGAAQQPAAPAPVVSRAPTPVVPRTPPPGVRPSAPDELNGDRLGMSLTEFKAKHDRRSEIDDQRYPLATDTIPIKARERTKLTPFSEESWHARAGIVNVLLASPREIASQSALAPKIGDTPAIRHVYRFLDQKLSSVEYIFPSAKFNDVAKALQQMYGPPGIDRENLKELYTKEHGGEFLYWRNGNTEMFLVERIADGEKTLLFFADEPMQRETMKRRGIILGK